MPAILTELFGRYRIVKKLGAGGMGEVYLAHDTQMDRPVALKIPQLEGRETDKVLEQFYREARIVARIRHPGVCPIYDVGAINDVHFLTMAFIDGQPLDQVLRAGRKPVAEAVELIRRIAEALHELHAQGIIHRDLKPANIMLQPDGVPVLLDFGLARSLSSQSQVMGSQTAATGTPAYMAPEQVGGQATQIRAWTDVYALGVILFELLTGRLPFESLNAVHYAMQVMQAERPRPSQFASGIPPALDALCLAMLAVDLNKRPGTMQEVVKRLNVLHAAPVSSATDISTRCPHCGKRVRITGSMAGRKVLCPGCKGRIDAPLEVPLPQTTPLESPLSQTSPTSSAPGLASVTEVEPLPDGKPTHPPDTIRIHRLSRLALLVCAVAMVVFSVLIVAGAPIDRSRGINMTVAALTGFLYLPLGLIAYFTRRSLRTAQVVLGTCVVMAVIEFPVVLCDLWLPPRTHSSGDAVFVLWVCCLLVELFLVPGLVIAKLRRRSRDRVAPR